MSHIPVSILWAYQKEQATINFEDARHLMECQDCVAILIMAHTCTSMRRLEEKLTEHGYTQDSSDPRPIERPRELV
jgi:hypothetical protein